jgi:hypothetical protein
MTREEIVQKIDELTRTFADTYDPVIPEEIYQLSRELEKIETAIRSSH